MSTAAPKQINHETKNGFFYFGLLPVILTVTLIVIFRLSPPSEAVFEPEYLLPVLNTIFLALIPFVVVYLLGQSYMKTGSPSILLISCALLVFGAGNLVAGWAIDHPGPNSTVTIHNLASFAASILYVMAAFAATAEGTSERTALRRIQKLVLSYFILVLFVGFISAATILGLMPPFFVPGVGPTPLRGIVLAVAIILHTLSAVFTLQLYWKRRTPFLYWYGLGLLLIAAGLAAVLIQSAVGSHIGWVGRISQYLGGVYFLAAVITAVRQARAAGTGTGETLASLFREPALHHVRLVQTARDPIILIDQRGEVLLWNPAAEKVFGYTRNESIGRRLIDLIGVDVPLGDLLQKDPAEGLETTLETSLKRRDGSIFFSEVSAWTTEMTDGRTVTFIVRDITERKQAEEVIRNSELLLRDVIDGSPSPIFLKDEDGKFITINSSLEKMLGVTREELKGKTDYDIAPKDVADGWWSHDLQVMKTGLPLQTEEVADLKDGHHVFLANKFPLVNSSGQVYGICAISHDITKIKEAEETIQSTLHRFYRILSNIHAAILVVTDDGFVEYANQAFCDYFRLTESPEQLQGLTALKIIDMIGPVYANPQEAITRIKQIVGDGKFVQGEEIAMAGGRTCLRDFVPLQVHGKSHGRVWYHLDISERKLAERALRLQAAVTETVAEGIFLVGVEDNIIKWTNTKFEKMFGYEPGQMIGMHVDKVNAPTEKTPTETRISITDLLLETGEWHGEIKSIKKDGTHFWCYINVSLFDHPEFGRVMVSAHTDITDRKRTDEALRRVHDDLEFRVQERTMQLAKSEREFRLLAEAMPQIVWITDADGLNIYFNRQWVDYTGLTLEESYGHGWNKPFHPDDRQRAWDAWHDAVTNNGTYSLESRLRKADGTYRWWLVRGVPVIDEKGEILKWFGTCTDIEDFKRTEEALRQAHKMEAIGTLAGGIAHDFNNILAAILGFTEMSIEDIGDRPDVQNNLQNVTKAATRARDLVKQILAFSRKAGHERRPFSLSPVIRETVQLLRASIPTTIEIKLSISATSDKVLAAPVEVQQILMNLATNASFAMQEKGGTMEVSLTDIDYAPDSSIVGLDMAPGEYIQLVVKDNGIGMKPELMKRIFDPFFTTREVGKGTGMGLAVVYGIVKDLQGTITIESELGIGSTFRVLLPKIKKATKEEIVRDAEIAGGTERILFVDDEKMLVDWGKSALERLGYTVTAVTDSMEALKIFSMNATFFDLVITDHAMPQMAGAQLATELLRIRNNTPIILCTGHSETMLPEKALEIGIKEYLMKPLARRELAEAIRRVLDAKPDA